MCNSNNMHHKHKAISFIELVIVVVIIGILAGVSIPRYASFLSTQRVESAARKIKMDLQFAKNRARISSSIRTVEFDVLNNSYRIVGMSDFNHKANEYQVFLDKPPYSAELVSVDFSATAKVTFDGYGVPDNSGTIVIQVGNNIETIYIYRPSNLVIPSPEI